MERERNLNIQKINEAEKILKDTNERLLGKVVTKISLLKNYCPAEEYHQKYIEKNKFNIKGKYKSELSNDGINTGEFNIAQGSIVVTAGGKILTEGIDYLVNYQNGNVQILDESLKNSNVPIEISTESNSFFNQQN